MEEDTLEERQERMPRMVSVLGAAYLQLFDVALFTRAPELELSSDHQEEASSSTFK